MPKNLPTNNKGVVLIIVLGTLLVVTIIANVILMTVLSQSRLTQHQVERIKAYYASMAGMNYALEMLRTENWKVPDAGNITYYCINGKIDSTVNCTTTLTDKDIPYNVQIAIHPYATTNPGGTAQIDIKTNYTEKYNL